MEASYSKEELRSRLRWYINLRWYLVAALGITGALPQFIQEGLSPQVRHNLTVVFFALQANALLAWLSASKHRPKGDYQILAGAQIVLDIIIMTLAVHYNGGIENIVIMLYIIPIIMSGALLGRKAIYATGLAAAVAYDTLLVLDYLGIVVSQNAQAPNLHNNLDYLIQTMCFASAMLLTIAALSDFVAKFVRQRTELAAELRIVTSERAEIQAILKSMGAALVAVDPESKIKLVNDSFEELTGWQRHEVIGSHIDTVLPLLDENGKRVQLDDRPMFQLLNQPAGAHKRGVQHISQYYYSRKDGSTFPFVGSLAPIMLGVDIIGATTVFEDATSTKKIQQLKSNFVALASHQLKTPVGEIRGYAANMLDGVTGPLTDQQRKYLESINELAANSLKLVTDLLDISVIERGDLVMNLKPVSLETVLEKGSAIYKERLHQKQLSLHIIPPAKPIMVHADSSKLTEVLGNVLANAVSYTKPNTTITVESGYAEGFGLIKVRDQGHGMSKKVIDSIFQKDNVLSAAPEAEGGTGIGLYLAKQLMTLQKGDISVLSTSDKGTTICIKIPLEGGSHDRHASKD